MPRSRASCSSASEDWNKCPLGSKDVQSLTQPPINGTCRSTGRGVQGQTIREGGTQSHGPHPRGEEAGLPPSGQGLRDGARAFTQPKPDPQEDPPLMLNRMRSREEGFTLIELLVVIVIIGI